ncbi:ABC transporter C family member 3-like [Phragmites australis]|uniref:ABC transporter C family member 3-like n=1 Tax=Phragmites australis TaxID=29695 RepID=UPI002D787198|nr:ABC transporter C family member 3-like [Phragmites australis]
MPASTAAPPYAAAMAATPAGNGPLVFFLQPLFLHGVAAVAHVLLALAVAGHVLFRRSGAGRAKDGEVRGGGAYRGGEGGFRCYGVAVFITWALAAFEVLHAAYSCYLDVGGAGWSRDAVSDLVDAASRAVGWLLLAAYLQFEFGRRRQERFPAPLRLWWALYLLLSVLVVTVHVATRLDGRPVPAHSWALDAVSVVAAVVLLFAGLFGKREGGGSASEEPLLNGAHERAEEDGRSATEASMFTGAGFLSALSFSWMGPLLAVGHKKTLCLDDVPGLDPGDSVAGLLPTFKANLEAVAADVSGSGRKVVTAFKLTKALVRTVWWHVSVTAFYALVYNVATYVGPYLIDSLVQYLNGDERYASKGQLLVLAFIVAKVFECLAQRHWFFRLQQAGIRARSALVAVVYQKGLALSSQSRQSRTSGEMINIISVDADRVGLFSWYMHDLWLVPLQVGMALFILYSTLGLASLAALGATVVVMLANVPPGQMQEKFQQKLMDCKDIRMKATSEILRNMRILKLQGWEMKFMSKIIELRKTETNWLKKYLYTSTMVTFVFWGAPTFVAVATFGACMLMGIPLESGKVLSALATFRVLQEPIYNLPDTISMMIQTKVSLDRIASFLCLDELPTDAVQRLTSGSSDVAIDVSNGLFSWEASPEVPTLKDLNFQARQGMLVAVCGTVGSGKSSLLSCILGEIPKLAGEVRTCGTMAYISQSAWIQSGKIQDNILFGKEMDNEKYERVLESCSLKKDLEILPFGDQTVIGERGINLSGGQKQRIQIARALYQEADIYLFDDPFSAVDAHTGSHLFKECLLGALASKTVVYVTHQIEFLPAADLILVMKDGRITQAGKYNEILGSGVEFMELVGAHKEALTALDAIDAANAGDVASPSSGTAKLSRSLSSAEKKDKQDDGNSQSGQLVQEEEREKGKVGFWVYWKYLTLAYKGALVPFVLLAQILFQVLQIASNYWMAWAAPVSKDVEPPVSMSTLLYVYVALALGSSLCVLVRALFLVTASYKTATLLFNKMHISIFRAPMFFFDSTPSGRILNRASTDQSEVDTSIAYQMGSVAFAIIQLVGIIAVMSHVSWQVFVVFIPVVAACFWYQRYYIDTARELQRLVGVCKAPIIQHFAESITGSTTIRCFGKENQFVSANSHLMDAYSRSKFYNAGAMDWLCFRLDVLSSLTFSFSLIFLINLPPGLIDPGIAGLAVTYGLNLNTQQAWVVWSMCNLENKIISVERILQYISIPAEPPLSMSEDKLAHNWPSEGKIQLDNLHVKYAPQLPFVLKGLTVTFPGGLKTGIVGRTGSGKSTLIQALFRIVDPTIGQILIDGVDICTIGLHDLRSRLSIIPQEPTMFEGTVRSNLDPLGEYNDNQIWEALDYCQLGDEIRKKELKLDSPVIENGENWSVGQRQLVCLGRVILKRSKILVLDEATASVDTATDNLIQKTLRQQFSEATVITIAHRITSVLNSDMVLLLDNGVAVERDTPAKLLDDKSSLFSKLVEEYTMRSTHT